MSEVPALQDGTLQDGTLQFSRTALLLGKDKVDILKNRRVAVFGIGGVGGICAEALCRCGVGAIDIFDGDVVEVSNINRQIIATHRVIGRDKVDVMRERLLDINPGLVINASKIFYLPENADGVDLSVYDYIVDAVDTMTAKLELVCRAAAVGVPIVSSMGTGYKLDPTAFEVADIYRTSVCPMARIMRKELRKRGIGALKVVYSREEGEKGDGSLSCLGSEKENRPLSRIGSVSFVPPVAGLILASEVIKDLLIATSTYK